MNRVIFTRWLLFALLLAGLAALYSRSAAGNQAGGALIVVISRADAYEIALDSLTRVLKTAGLALSVARTADDVRSKNRPIRVVAALGPEALSEALQAWPDVPVVAGMVLRSTVVGFRGHGGTLAGAAIVDVPFEVLIEHLHRVYPRLARVGVVRNPSRPDPEPAELESIGLQYGLRVKAGDASGPQSLAAVYSNLARTSDVVICFPDALLYNSTTVQALILASLRTKVPIVGFSEGFVRAGALLGVYPDYEIVGRQTAAALISVIGGHKDRTEWPVNAYKVAVNSRVERLVNFRPDPRANRFLTIIQ